MRVAIKMLAGLILLYLSLLIHSASAQPINAFHINVSPTTITIDAGESGSVLFSVNKIGEYNESVTVTVEDVPSALSVSVSPSSGTPDFNGTVRVIVRPWAEGRYTFTLKGTGADGWVSAVTITVKVPYFTLSASQPVLVVKNGSSVSTIIRVLSIYGYNEKVTLSLLDAPDYVDAVLSKRSGSPSYSSTLTVRADGDAPFETRWLKVRAVGADGKVKTKSVELAVVYVGVKVEIHTVLDGYGRPRRNADGTFYPGDAFNVTFTAETRNIEFRLLRFRFDEGAFYGSAISTASSGWMVLEIKKSASAGRYFLNVTAEAAYTSASGGRVIVASSASVPVEIVAYNPHFTVLTSYIILNGGGGSVFGKPLAIIVRYDGNGPDYNLDQRAVIDGFRWMGTAFTNIKYENRTVPSPSPGETIFYAEGLNLDMIDPYTPIIMVDGVQYYAYDLPLHFRWPLGSSHKYEWTDEVWCTVDPGAKFTYYGIFGLNRTGTLTQSPLGCIVTGYYMLSKPLKLFAEDVEKPVVWLDTVEVAVNITGKTSVRELLRTAESSGRISSNIVKFLVNRRSYPLLLDRNVRYAKLIVDVNDTVADRMEQSIYRELDLYVTFTSEAFTPEPITLFTANHSYVKQSYMQPFTAKAYRLQDGRWRIDDDVWMRIIFSPSWNVTADMYTAYYEQIRRDQVALEMMRQDYTYLTDQVFTGHGTVKGEVLNCIFIYNVTVTAISRERRVSRSFPALLYKAKGEIYPIYVNLKGGGVSATVIRDAGRSATILFKAPPEAGGIINITVTDEEGRVLYERRYPSSNIKSGVFGFSGETTIYIRKTLGTGTNLTLTATNIWGAESTVNLTVKPYSKQDHLINLDGAVYWLTPIIIAAISINILLLHLKT